MNTLSAILWFLIFDAIFYWIVRLGGRARVYYFYSGLDFCKTDIGPA